jgi:uncharacterized DUF497 family protein
VARHPPPGRLGSAHALYIHDGHWYHPLKRFPGALFDRSGYILFRTEEEFRECRYLSIGKDVSVPKPGISAIPGYVRVVGPPSRPAGYPPEEVLGDGSFPEGSVVRIHVNRYERDARARAKCIQHYGPRYDPVAATFGDPDHSEDESRLVTVGYSARGRLLVVCHVERGSATRLINARRATVRERKRHET